MACFVWDAEAKEHLRRLQTANSLFHCADCCKAVDVKTTAQHSLSHSNLNLHHLKGASEEVNRAIDAIKAEIQEALYLRNFSLTSSGVGHDDEPEVADEHLCPICLVRRPLPLAGAKGTEEVVDRAAF